jgi:hypothetical protein
VAVGAWPVAAIFFPVSYLNSSAST